MTRLGKILPFGRIFFALGKIFSGVYLLLGDFLGKILFTLGKFFSKSIYYWANFFRDLGEFFYKPSGHTGLSGGGASSRATTFCQRSPSSNPWTDLAFAVQN